ncbi:ATP-dependent helicase-like [Pyrus ussuriensis x Pyrus communis]|uniref:ATP-dependent helicase-like n=1 Tax=Pyrus ussuriensis x Pyrus communis TaxID=2448454 RepID=A0A5N5FB12_9ROSA|nr:ATP-dependent helicase-like [Pyrus ussuriensis x Pyrus communis]
MDRQKKSTKLSNYGVAAARPLINTVFSWSLEDVLNAHLYRNQVTKIPETFSTMTSYMKSFIPSLVEETHADLLSSMMNLSQAPTLEILTVKTSKNHGPPKDLFYDVTCVGTYVPQVGDLIALTDIKPKCVDHLNGPRISYLIAYVHQSRDSNLSILSSRHIDTGRYVHIKSKTDTLFAVYLMNMTTTVRVWKALNSKGANTSSTKNLLQPQANSSQKVYSPDKVCMFLSTWLTSLIFCLCLLQGRNSCSIFFDNEKCYLSATFRAMCSDLNDSQKAAVLNCISLSKCNHRNSIKLIWGPPVTGKTKTVGLSLFVLKYGPARCRTLTCAPTNIAVLEVTARVLSLVNQSLDYEDDHDDLVDVFLDYRTKILAECFAPLSGWKHRLASMIDLVQDPKEKYALYLKEKRKRYNVGEEGNNTWTTTLKGVIMSLINGRNPTSDDDNDLMTFEEFVKEKFYSIGECLKICMVNLYTHLPTSSMSIEVVKDIITALDLLNSCKYIFDEVGSLRAFSVPILTDDKEIGNFCLENACLICCTVSSSSKLYTKGMKPVEILMVREAAQLKECESLIPLQLPCLCHAILIGDERQLPAMVKSKISEKAVFGRSLFERLVQLGHEKLLLNVQYRMHPSISLFPNREFCNHRLLDANGKEEFDRGSSQKNMAEVAVVYEIVASLAKFRCNENGSVGFLSNRQSANVMPRQ